MEGGYDGGGEIGTGGFLLVTTCGGRLWPGRYFRGELCPLLPGWGCMTRGVDTKQGRV